MPLDGRMRQSAELQKLRIYFFSGQITNPFGTTITFLAERKEEINWNITIRVEKVK